MNKDIILKSITTICVFIFIAAIVVSVNRVIGYASYGYADADKYTIGNTEISKPVRNLDIDWTSGVVHVAYHKGDTVLLTETADKPISKDRQMRWWLDGDTLRVRYAKQSFALFSITPELKKELTLTLPEGAVLKDAKIGATSGTLDIPLLQASKTDLSTTSGEIIAAVQAPEILCDATSGSIQLEVLGDTELISAEATSGGIQLSTGKTAKKISAETTSGNIYIEAESADEIRGESTSGSINSSLQSAGIIKVSSTSGNLGIQVGQAETIKTDSTSGTVQIEAGRVDQLEAESTSGNITALLGTEPGFTARLDTTSGKVNYDLPLTKQGKDYICGNGKGTVKIDTTSGDILLGAVRE